MKILVIGGGAREHALIWKLRRSPHVEGVWCIPGNGGISGDAESLAGNLGNVQALAGEAEKLKPDVTLVGPEQPLVLGIVDEFARRKLAIIGPSGDAAKLEGSKVFAKEFMQRNGIPTAAAYGIFDASVDAYTSLCAVDWPVVVKADGLCGGKGVLVTTSPDEATDFIARLMEKKEFGEAGARVIVEEGLAGQEISYIVLTDGEKFLPLAAARDYKRAFDGGQGPNTGGMGAISSETLLSAEVEKAIQTSIVAPTIRAMAREGHNYSGFLYFGLMLTADGPKVLEFNCRLGDPETEALVMRMNFDLADVLAHLAHGALEKVKMDWSPAASACVVLAAEGYPGRARTGEKIEGLVSGNSNDVAVFHGGTKREGPNYYVNSGRALAVAACGPSLAVARQKAYAVAGGIHWPGMHYRSDIGGETGEVAHG